MANNAHQNVDMRREGKCIWPFCCATAPWLNVLYQRINSTPTKVLLSQRPQCLWKNQSFQSFPQLWDRLISCGSLFIQGHQVRLWLPWILQSYPSFLHLIFDSVSFELQFGPSSFLLHKNFHTKNKLCGQWIHDFFVQIDDVEYTNPWLPLCQKSPGKMFAHFFSDQAPLP